MMVEVELIYDSDCPNVTQARRQLLLAYAATEVRPRWQEWERGDPAAPAHVRAFGSPTILIGGEDVAGFKPGGELSACRVYPDGKGGYSGVPTVEFIVTALTAAGLATGRVGHGARASGWRSSLAAAPGILLAFLPKVTCPACWPAYAGVLSSLGLGFLLETAYLLPFMLLFLAIAVGTLAFRARRRRGFRPALLGLLASAIVIVGKFRFDSDLVMYCGIALLVAASLWNAWPRPKTEDACPACASAGSDTQLLEARPTNP